VLGYLNASLQGLSTIRAFEAEEVLSREFDGHQVRETTRGTNALYHPMQIFRFFFFELTYCNYLRTMVQSEFVGRI